MTDPFRVPTNVKFELDDCEEHFPEAIRLYSCPIHVSLYRRLAKISEAML